MLQICDRKGINPSERLIKQQIARAFKADSKSAGHLAASSFTTGELKSLAVQKGLQMKIINQLVQPFAGLWFGESGLRQNEFEILLNG